MKDNEKQITWGNLSQEEKKEYLGFWFNYYGSLIYTLEEYDKFLKLVDTKADDIYAHICTSFVFGNTIQSTVLLGAMRKDKIDDLFKTNISEDTIKDLKISEEEKNNLVSYLKEVRVCIINEMAKSFNNPEPSEYITTVEVKPRSKR